MPTVAATLNTGSTATGAGHNEPIASADTCAVSAIPMAATATAAGTA